MKSKKATHNFSVIVLGIFMIMLLSFGMFYFSGNAEKTGMANE